MIRRYGDTPVAGQRYQKRPGVYAILPLDGKLLLTYQGDPHFEIQLPGGGIDPGEHPLTALHREVFEETGWRIANPRKLGTFRRFAYMPEYDMWAEKLCHIFVARPCFARSAPSEPDHSSFWVDEETAIKILGSDGNRLWVSRWRAYSAP